MKVPTRHPRSLWGPWWPLPGGLFAGYVAVLGLLGDVRPEPFVALAVVLALAYGGETLKRFFLAFSPLVVFGVCYDLFRHVHPYTLAPDRVLACELRNLDARLFPISTGTSIQVWLTQQTSVPLDLISAIPYGIHAYVPIVYSVFLYVKDRPRMRRYLLAFTWANFLALAIWALFPAAPPWYVHQYGCAIDPTVPSSAAGLLRTDQVLGVPIYEQLYSRNASVFAALPSMHNGFAMVGLLTAWRHIGWRTRPLHLLYVGVMLFASLYLDHHWIVDALAGWAVAWAGVVLSSHTLRWLEANAAKRTQTVS